MGTAAQHEDKAERLLDQDWPRLTHSERNRLVAEASTHALLAISKRLGSCG